MPVHVSPALLKHEPRLKDLVVAAGGQLSPQLSTLATTRSPQRKLVSGEFVMSFKCVCTCALIRDQMCVSTSVLDACDDMGNTGSFFFNDPFLALK